MITKVKNVTSKTIIIPTLKNETDAPMHVIGRMIHKGAVDDLAVDYNQQQLAAAQTQILNYIARGWLEEVQ